MKLHERAMDTFAEEFSLYEDMWDEETQEPVANESQEEEEPDADFMQLISTPEGLDELFDYCVEYRLKIHKIASQDNPKKVSNIINELVNKLINEHDDFDLEYEGFEQEWHEDHFDPALPYGHYDTGGTTWHDDFTYNKDAGDMFELIRDTILPKYLNHPKYKNLSLVSDFAELDDAYNKATSEEEQQIILDEQDLLVAGNLDSLFDSFDTIIVSRYSDEAYEWAD